MNVSCMELNSKSGIPLFFGHGYVRTTFKIPSELLLCHIEPETGSSNSSFTAFNELLVVAQAERTTPGSFNKSSHQVSLSPFPQAWNLLIIHSISWQDTGILGNIDLGGVRKIF